MSYGKVISLNDEPILVPKIRKDQQRKIQGIVRNNAAFPEVALGLVRDYLKSIDEVKSVQYSKEEDMIKVIMKNDYSKMYTEYTFRLSAPILLETPTL